jgi:hypothetical protein
MKNHATTQISKIIIFKSETLTETLICFVGFGFLDILIISSANTNIKYIKNNITEFHRKIFIKF